MYSVWPTNSIEPNLQDSFMNLAKGSISRQSPTAPGVIITPHRELRLDSASFSSINLKMSSDIA
jgi:hypothetical protein